MPKYVLTVVDTIGIQDYVFGTNNLQQNVGASFLVDCATRDWAIQSIPCSHNVTNLDDKEQPYNNKKIEKGEIQSEVIYAGGGNILLLFENLDFAKEFTRRLTKKIQVDAHGLKIVVTHKEFSWESDLLGGKNGVFQETMRQLAQKKSDPPFSKTFSGLAVTTECVFTGAPATTIDLDQRPISPEAQSKLSTEPEARKRLAGLINFHDYSEPPSNFDDLGQSSGEKSYLAVIHTDGNNMGKRVEAIRDRAENLVPGEGNRAYIGSIRAFSISVQKAASEALQKTVDLVIENIDKKTGKIGDVVKVAGKRLPFRPIVFGGDDVTFVCDGRIGLSLAEYYLQQYAAHMLSDGEPAHCRAGVAIVHTHFPFSRSYQLAESLCASASQFIKSNGDNFSAIDWHYASSGVIHDLEEIRQREYSSDEGDLFMRPVRLTQQEKDWRSWDNFVNTVTEFQSGGDWAGRHNKVIALRGALREGESATKNYMTLYQIKALPKLTGWPEENHLAWWNNKCGYFDAVETVDLFVPLKIRGQK